MSLLGNRPSQTTLFSLMTIALLSLSLCGETKSGTLKMAYLPPKG